jgi:hypothetical protein
MVGTMGPCFKCQAVISLIWPDRLRQGLPSPSGQLRGSAQRWAGAEPVGIAGVGEGSFTFGIESRFSGRTDGSPCSPAGRSLCAWFFPGLKPPLMLPAAPGTPVAFEAVSLERAEGACSMVYNQT